MFLIEKPRKKLVIANREDPPIHLSPTFPAHQIAHSVCLGPALTEQLDLSSLTGLVTGRVSVSAHASIRGDSEISKECCLCLRHRLATVFRGAEAT